MADHTVTAILQVAGVKRASSARVAKSTLLRRPGALAVSVNPVSQTANITFDDNVTGVADQGASTLTLWTMGIKPMTTASHSFGSETHIKKSGSAYEFRHGFRK